MSTPSPVTPEQARAAAPHPALYTALIIPFGAISGFTAVALGFMATRNGLTELDAAAIIAFGMAPQVVKFLWAPLCDMTLNRKAWYAMSAVVCIVGVIAMSSIPLGPATIGLMKGVVLAASLATSFLGMAVEGMIAHLTPPDDRGRAGGWLQAGNLGGNGIGGGAGLYLMTHLPQPWMAGAVIATVFALCSLALLRLPSVPSDPSDQGVVAAVVGIVRDVFGLLFSKTGLFAMILCFAPISTGAAGGVLAQSTVAAHWGASEDDVALVNGLLSGSIAAFGCFVGGQLCSYARARTVYAAVGAVMAAVALAMAFGPTTRATFIVGGLAYMFTTGLAYASWTGFILETIGKSGAATKYNIFASLSNTPITYMGLVLGAVVSGEVLAGVQLPKLGAVGMLQVEAATGFVGILIVLGFAQLLLRDQTAASGTPAAA